MIPEETTPTIEQESTHHTGRRKKLRERLVFMQEDKFLIPVAILTGAILIAGSILYTGGVFHRSGDTGTSSEGIVTTVPPTPTAQQPAAQPSTTTAQVAIENFPTFGKKDAPVTIVEFSDYECPFCKSFFTSTYPQIKSQYVDTGKVRYVFRNYPLSFHQNAHRQAEAGLCVREQGGDTAYFKYHDYIFTNTTSNGLGYALDRLPEAAVAAGVNKAKFEACLSSDKYKTVVDQDMAAGSVAGVTGTPAFFVGKTGDGKTITGTKLVGAQPYASFQSLIDQQLK